MNKYFIILSDDGIKKYDINNNTYPSTYGVFNILNEYDDITFYIDVYYNEYITDINLNDYIFIKTSPQNGYNNPYFPRFKGPILILKKNYKEAYYLLMEEIETDKIIKFFENLKSEFIPIF